MLCRLLIASLALASVLTLTVVCAGSAPGGTSPEDASPSAPDPAASASDDPYDMAAAYSADRAGDAVLVWTGGDLVMERYQNGYDPDTPHMLASGSKTFSGLMAWTAQADGVLSIDDRLAGALPTWRDDPSRSKATLRQLLHLTAGLPGGIGRAPSFEDAVEADLVHAPGEGFRYGPTAFQVFGAVLKEKLEGEDPAGYLQRRILDPIGASVVWRRVEGDPQLAGGARMTARDWLRVGRLILQDGAWDGAQVIPAGLCEALATPTDASPGYGLTTWINAQLHPDDPFFDHAPANLRPASAGRVIYPDGPADLFMAAGLFNQRLYIVPSRELVAVRFGRRDATWNDAEFLARLLDGVAYDAPAPSPKVRALRAQQAASLLADRYLATLDSVLTLDVEQEAALRSVVADHVADLVDIRRERERREPLSWRDRRAMRRQMRRLQEAFDAAVEAELTGPQIDRYRVYREEQRDALREQLRDR
jgi:CubicO group peptidase (beta-lactamase class C family)